MNWNLNKVCNQQLYQADVEYLFENVGAGKSIKDKVHRIVAEHERTAGKTTAELIGQDFNEIAERLGDYVIDKIAKDG